MLDELGPTFVKFGQLLSTRRTSCRRTSSPSYAASRTTSACSFELARQSIEEQLGEPIERLFLEFEEVLMAAASINRSIVRSSWNVTASPSACSARARRGRSRQTCRSCTRRHGLRRSVFGHFDFIDTHELVDEFARSIRQELDYRLEARIADTFRRNFAGHPHVKIPAPLSCHTRTRPHARVPRGDAGRRRGRARPDDRRSPPARVPDDRGVDDDDLPPAGLFHGDPHPANVLVLGRPDRSAWWTSASRASWTDSDISKATRLFIDAANENVDVLPKRLADLGVRYPPELEEQFVAELRRALLPVLRGLSVGHRPAPGDPRGLRPDLSRQSEAADAALARRPSRRPRAVIELYLEFNVFEVAKPYARSLMIRRFTPRRIAQSASREAVNLTQTARELPYQVHDTLGAVPLRPDRGHFVRQGLGRVHAEGRHRLQLPDRRDDRRRRPHRLRPDRSLRHRRRALRHQLPRRHRLRGALRRARSGCSSILLPGRI